MRIKCLPVGQLETNCYVVADETTLECAVIDPGDESNTILDAVEAQGLTVRAILLTHGHFDHTGAVSALREETGAPVWIHRLDAAEAPGEAFRFYAPDAAHYAQGDQIAVGALTFTVLETPGHSPGSVTLQCEEALFTGDTLFRDGAGRTDLPGGQLELELASLRRLDLLPGDYEVWPGHMDATTLERERAVNRYLRAARSVR